MYYSLNHLQFTGLISHNRTPANSIIPMDFDDLQLSFLPHHAFHRNQVMELTLAWPFQPREWQLAQFWGWEWLLVLMVAVIEFMFTQYVPSTDSTVISPYRCPSTKIWHYCEQMCEEQSCLHCKHSERVPPYLLRRSCESIVLEASSCFLCYQIDCPNNFPPGLHFHFWCNYFELMEGHYSLAVDNELYHC